jgi:hypothetical protein
MLYILACQFILTIYARIESTIAVSNRFDDDRASGTKMLCLQLGRHFRTQLEGDELFDYIFIMVLTQLQTTNDIAPNWNSVASIINSFVLCSVWGGADFDQLLAILSSLRRRISMVEMIWTWCVPDIVIKSQSPTWLSLSQLQL